MSLLIQGVTMLGEVREQSLLLFDELRFTEIELLLSRRDQSLVFVPLGSQAFDGNAERFGLFGDLHLARAQAMLARVEVCFTLTNFGAVLVQLRVGSDFRSGEGFDFLLELDNLLFQF